MSRVTMCDICGRTISCGFCISVKSQCEHSCMDVADIVLEEGRRDICAECYYLIKRYSIALRSFTINLQDEKEEKQ